MGTKTLRQRARIWILATALASPGLAHAGAGVWTSGGPYGADVYTLAVDPANPSTLYAGTGAGVFKTTTAGGGWASVNTGLTNLSVAALVIDPTVSSRLYVGTNGGGIFKSTDSGATWAVSGTGLTNSQVLALAVVPTGPAVLYAGTNGGGIFKSTDSGATWAAVNTGLTNSRVLALAVVPTSPGVLYAGTYGSGIFKSIDSGATWAPSGTGLTFPFVYTLAIDPTTPSTIYAGTRDGGVFKSANGGGNWVPANTGLPNQGSVLTLAIDPTNPATIYAGGSGVFNGVFKTTTAGGTWFAVNNGLTSPFVAALAIDPTTPSTIYAGTIEFEGGIFKSPDSGGTWAPATDGITNLFINVVAADPSTPTTLYAGALNGIFRSTNAGSSWASVNTGPLAPFRRIYSVAIDSTSPTTLYAGGDGGVFKSTDAGGTWAAVSTGLPQFSTVYALALGSNPSTIYAGTADELFRSTNAGGSWNGTGLTGQSVEALVIDPLTPATLYACGSGGVLKSTDSGSTWAPVNDGLTAPYVLALSIDPSDPATLYAGGSGGVFKSTNAGGAWTSVGLTSSTVNALTLGATPSLVYAGTSGGVFRSTDAGSTWTAVNKGLTNPDVNALALDPTGAGTLYAGLWGGSVWQATPPTGADADLAITLSDSPDPVRGTTPLTYTLHVANAGPGAVGSLTVTQTLPAGGVLDGASGSGWSCTPLAGVVTCTRPGLAVGTAPDIAVRVTPGPAATVLSSSATVSAAETDPNPANNSDTETTTVSQALVWLGTRTKTVVAAAGRFVTNGGVNYTITLTNSGTQAQADNPGPEFQDVLPSSLTLVSASATSGTAVANLAGNSVTWDGSIPSGGSVTLTIHATVKPTVALGTTVTNQGTAYYDADGNGTSEAAALTDDPGRPGTNDSTTFVVVSPMALYTLPPCRLLDTRDAPGAFGGPALLANTDRVFPLFDRCGIPPTARALSVNMTVTQPTTAGNLRLYPAGTPLPNASSINYTAGQTRANNAAVPMNGLGELAVFCAQASGTAHFILDVNGYFE